MQTALFGTHSQAPGPQGARGRQYLTVLAKSGRQPWIPDRNSDPALRGDKAMEDVQRIVTSGMAVWLTIVASMSVFL